MSDVAVTEDERCELSHPLVGRCRLKKGHEGGHYADIGPSSTICGHYVCDNDSVFGECRGDAEPEEWR